MIPSLDITRIAIVLSNQCPLAPFHRKCPASRVTSIEVLPSFIVHDVIDTLVVHKYTGGICWHTYNEPMSDPRLFSFIEYSRTHLPESDVFLWTSGYYLTEETAKELVDVGVRMVYLTAYSQSEHDRLSVICESVDSDWRIFRSYTKNGAPKLDDRLQTHIDAIPTEKRLECNAPLGDFTIWPSGEVGLCCYDWKRENVFGSLRDVSFGVFLEEHYKEMQLITKQNRQQKHPLPICQRCEKRR